MSISPYLRRVLFHPLFALKDRSKHLQYLKRFEHLQYLPETELKNIQFLNLKKLIFHAFNNTSYYRKIFNRVKFVPKNFNTIENIQELPILTKEIIQTKTDELIAQGYDKQSLMKFKTGGSTGKSLTVYSNMERFEKGLAAGLMCFRWAGWNIGEPMARVWGNPPLLKSKKEILKFYLLQPTIWLDTMNLNDSSMSDFIKKWAVINPTLLHGHAHSLFIFSGFLRRNNIKIKPNGIISTSMVLLPSERTFIEETFLKKVTNLYGCEEVGLIACECEKNEGMHLNILNNFIEFIREDGSPASPGERGTILVTSLTNYAMPLIRYRIEDMGVPSSVQCSCGRGLPLMEKLTGRVADFLIKRNGSLVAGISLIERTLTKIPGIQQMQIIQNQIDNFHINIVKNDSYCDTSQSDLIKEFQYVFGNLIKLDIHFVQNIKQELSGKYRFSICKINKNQVGNTI